MTQCVAMTHAGTGQCKKSAINGATVCRSHGATTAVRRKALVRATLTEWGLTDSHVDPGETLLRLVSQSARRADFLAGLLRQAYEAADLVGEQSPFALPSGVSALVEHRYKTTQDGNTLYVEEAIRALVILEGQERKLLADFCAKAISAGLAERQVRLAEAQGAAIIGAILVALDRAGIQGPARLEAQDAAADYLLQLT